MIDGNHPQLVDVVHFFHRLHEAHADFSIRQRDVRAVDLYPLTRIRRVAARGRKPMPHHGRTNHIRHKFVSMPIPHKQHGARAAAAIHFLHRDHALSAANRSRPAKLPSAKECAVSRCRWHCPRPTRICGGACVWYPDAPASSHFCHSPFANTSTFAPIPVLLSA